MSSAINDKKTTSTKLNHWASSLLTGASSGSNITWTHQTAGKGRSVLAIKNGN
jgi:hypothetical protein